MSFDTVSFGHSLGAKEEPYQKGHVLARPGTVQETGYIIVSGLVRQYDIRENGTDITLNLYKPGSIISLPWILTEAPNTSFFECVSACVLLPLPTATLRHAFHSNSDLTLATLTRLARGIDGMLQRLAAHSSNDASYRLLTELTVEAARFGTTHQYGTQVTITPSELAARTGLSRETVSRQLSHLQKTGRLSRAPKGYIVHQM